MKPPPVKPATGNPAMAIPNMAEIAADYAAGGALVFPLHTPDPDHQAGCSCRSRDCGDGAGKHPRVMGGHTVATSDPVTVAGWWAMWPTANIGLRPHLGQVVLDIDPRSGGALQAVAMQRRHGQLPPTRTAATGGGGWHLWYLHEGDVVSKIAPGLDIKDHSGFVVAPPSLHASTARYTWTDTGPIRPAPDWLAGLINRRPVSTSPVTGAVTEGRLHGLVHYVATAPPGTRNSRTYWAAARLHEVGADVAPIIAAALKAGLSEREATRTAASAASAPRAGGGR